MNIRWTHALLTAFAAVLWFVSCSQDNFLPMTFEPTSNGSDKAELTTSWKSFSLAAYQKQTSYVLAQPGYCYDVEVQTADPLYFSPYVQRAGIPDSVPLQHLYFGHGGTGALLCAIVQCTVVVSIQSYYSTPATFSARIIKSPLPAAGNGSYIDTVAGTGKGKPVRHVVSEPAYLDTAGFDQPLTKFTYAVPLDSFEECSLEFLTVRDTFHNTLPVRGYAASAHFDTLPQLRTNEFSGVLSYWNSIADTLFVTLYIPRQPEFDMSLAYGFWQTCPPSIIISMQKNHHQGVMADAFDGMAATDILLKQDSLYSLTLRSFRETDALTWAVRSDSIYMVTVESLEKQQLELEVSGNETGLLRSVFTEKDTLIFRPVSWGRYIRCSISSVMNTPSTYSISLAPYKGPDHADSFEPDFILTNATLLAEGATQEHTIFPENENDFFKMECTGSDTFSFEIAFHSSSVPRDSLGFSFAASFSDILGDFRYISKTDSGSITRYTYSKDLPDTLFFRATARKYTEYSIMLRR